MPAAKRVKGGIRSTSPAFNSMTPASNSDFPMGGGTMTHPTLSPESVSSSISNITKALLLDESSGSTSEPADTREAVTDTDGDVFTNEAPEMEEAMVDIVEGVAGSLSEPVDGSCFKAVEDGSGSKCKSSETKVVDLEVGAASPSRKPITIQFEASQSISDLNTQSASDPRHLSKNDEEVSLHCLQFHRQSANL